MKSDSNPKAKGTVKPAGKPTVFSYLDYRKFLAEWVEWSRLEHSFSERSFATKAGFGSPSYLKMIVDAKRNLGAKSIQGLAKALELKTDELEFFEALIVFNQTAELEAKTEAYKKLLSFKKFHKVHKIEAGSYEYYSRWQNVALREALITKQGKVNPSQLSRSLNLSAREFDQALLLLQDLKLIEVQKDGTYLPTNSALKTESEIKSLVVRNFHRQMIEKALSSLDSVKPEERDMSALTIALSQRNLEEIKKRVAQFRNEINALFSDDPEADQVYQFNFQVFPLLVEEKKQ